MIKESYENALKEDSKPYKNEVEVEEEEQKQPARVSFDEIKPKEEAFSAIA